MNDNPWYLDESFWRGCYQVLFTKERFAQAPSEIENVLTLVNFNGQRILDMPCGPGRHTVVLAQQGYQVTGVDHSEYLLAKAEKYARDSNIAVEWVKADMRDFSRTNAYDLVQNLFSSFGYFEDQDDDIKLLSNFYESLRSGGKIILDLKSREILTRDWTPDLSTPVQVNSQLSEKLELDPDKRWIRTEWTVIRHGKRHRYHFQLRLYSADELSTLLTRAGFVNVRTYGSLAGVPYSDESLRLVIVAEKE